MTGSFGELPSSFVVVFFHTKAGELCCRVTDVFSRKTWIIEGAPSLWRLLAKQSPSAIDEGEARA